MICNYLDFVDPGCFLFHLSAHNVLDELTLRLGPSGTTAALGLCTAEEVVSKARFVSDVLLDVILMRIVVVQKCYRMIYRD